ncbi:CRP-like cAMP-binding protein [Epilithonimonas hungarica]|uniref:Crp/Fnr family transcriptional regulator n=1 Tax=Epilithonimonas hungarica TaxID=454006 RepID=UPI0012C2C2F0|nr:Crp/Fnr family transcriptional regulator [Epilithonimonas hungarica]MDP9955679.1 CRP-like cAMP-binding protein [Epilithonimonas hungarica]MPT32776.1 Crp/Fnr family transcriptional regulator [Chryseobacterium sp.]
MDVLKNIYQHPAFSEEGLSLIFSKHEKINYKKGDFFLKENEISNDYFVLESGVVRSFVYDINNDDITINFFTINDIIIEASSIFQRIPSIENIQAETDCVVWKISYEDFQELFHSIPALTEWGRAWMSYQLFYLKNRSVEMITKSATERYLSLIEEKPDVLKFAPLKNVASYLGITDTSLSRIRKEIVKG